jgi:hypothetical protein
MLWRIIYQLQKKNTHTQARTHAHTHPSTHPCTHTCRNVCTHAHTYIYIYIYISILITLALGRFSSVRKESSFFILQMWIFTLKLNKPFLSKFLFTIFVPSCTFQMVNFDINNFCNLFIVTCDATCVTWHWMALQNYPTHQQFFAHFFQLNIKWWFLPFVFFWRCKCYTFFSNIPLIKST